MLVKPFTLAIYARLSKEDGESNSVQNQISMMRNYIQNRQDLQNYSIVEYCDDGFSGTNFNRPGITELLTCVKEKKIQYIVVKDFSRFGRNYLEVGYYIEKVFPVLGVRFISINDNYDNNKLISHHSAMEAAVKNLLYDYYSKDLSQKVKASFKVKKEQGFYLGGGIPYGYLRSQYNRGQIIIDEEAAVVVRRIFQMTKEGSTRSQIARILNEEDIPSPAEHIMKLKKNQTVWTQPRNKYYWTLDVITRILRNQVYIGNTVNNKYQVKEIGSKQTILLPKKNWNIVLNTHEAVIAKDLFEAVQKTFQKSKSKMSNTKIYNVEKCKKKARDNILSGIIQGKLKCGYCNYYMDLIKTKNPYYQCISHRFLPLTECSREHADVLQMENLVVLILLNYKKLLLNSSYRNDNSSYKNCENNAVIIELKQIKLKEMRCYEKYKSNRLCKEEYIKQKADSRLRKIEIHKILGESNQEHPLGIEKDNVKHFTGKQDEKSHCSQDISESIKKLANVWVNTIYFYDANHIEIELRLHDGFITKAMV